MVLRFIDHRMLFPSPADVPAWYDFATNIIGNAATYDELRASVGGVRHLDLNETDTILSQLLHEQSHFIQAVGTTFVNEWQLQWARLADSALLGMRDTLAANGLLAATKAWDDPDLREAANNHVARLHRPGRLGISASGLMESHAMFLEATVHTNINDAQGFAAYLDAQAPAPRYRRAYDVMSLWCGHLKAFDLFHAVVSVALSCSEPGDGFDQMVAAASRHSTGLNDFVSTAAELWHRPLQQCWINRKEATRDDTLRPYFAAFLDWIDEVGPATYLRDPKTLVGFDVTPSTMLGADDSNNFALIPGTFETRWVGEDRDQAQGRVAFDLSVTAVSQWLIRSSESGAQQNESMDHAKYDWLDDVSVEDSNLRVAIDVFVDANTKSSVSLSNDLATAASDAAAFLVRMDGEQELKSPDVSKVRRVWLSFDTDRPEEVWEMPAVQEFVRRLAELCPWAPVYLRYDKAETMLVMWFGSLVPEAISGTGLDTSHPGFLREVERFLDGLERVSRPDRDLEPLIGPTLAPLLFPPGVGLSSAWAS